MYVELATGLYTWVVNLVCCEMLGYGLHYTWALRGTDMSLHLRYHCFACMFDLGRSGAASLLN